MPVWLAVVLAVMGSVMTALGTTATVVNVRGSRQDAARKAITDEITIWREDTKALRERLKATEDRCDQIEEQCRIDLAEGQKRITALERQCLDLAVDLATIRRGEARP